MNIEHYRPDFMLERVYYLTADALKEKGFTTVLVDLDNTLLAWNNPKGTPEMRAWLEDMKEAGIQVVVVSNNTYKRVKEAVEPFGIPFEARAMKPFNLGIARAMKRFGLSQKEVVMVGDQLMTDIRASKRAGIASVLVQPMVTSDAWETQFNRWRERRVKTKIEAQYGPFDYKDSI